MTKFYLKTVPKSCIKILKNVLIQYTVILPIFTLCILPIFTLCILPIFTLFTFTLSSNELNAQAITYPEVVKPHSLVEVSTTPTSPDYDLNYLIMQPIELTSNTYEDNKYLVFASPSSGQIVILVQYVDYSARKSLLEKLVITVKKSPDPDPDPDPDPTNLDQLVEHWINKVPSEFRSPAKVNAVGENYIVAADDVSNTSTTPRDEMVGRVKVLNLQTLGPEASRQWAVPFFLPLAKWMDNENIDPKDYINQKKMFTDVGVSIRKSKINKNKEDKPIPFRGHTST